MELDLYAEENLDRNSPILWPEVIPGVEKFTDSFNGSFTSDYSGQQGGTSAQQQKHTENEQVLAKRTVELKRLNEHQLLGEIKALKERAYRIGLEEAKEVERGKMLNVFGDFRHETK